MKGRRLDRIRRKGRWLAVAALAPVAALSAVLLMSHLRQAEAPGLRWQPSPLEEGRSLGQDTEMHSVAPVVRVDSVTQQGEPGALATEMNIHLSPGEMLAGRMILDLPALNRAMRAGSSARVALRFPIAPGRGAIAELSGPVTLADDGASWQAKGSISGMPESRVVLTKWKDRIFGTVHALAEGEFEWRQQNDGSLAVVRFEPALLPDCEEDADGLSDEDEGELAAPSADAPSPTSTAREVAAGKSYVDVVVGYNEQARVSVGGHPANSEDVAAIETKILTAVANANTAYKDSAIDLEMRLAWLGPIAYNYPLTESLDRALDEIEDPDDGRADELSRKKEEYGADFACLWIDSSVSGGNASVITSQFWSGRAYSLVRAKNPTATFVHEIGHNMGCRHLRDGYTGTPSSWKPYAFARLFTAGDAKKYVTVMASTDDQSRTGAAARLLRFSNPRVTYLGTPTGVADDTDCARSLEEIRPLLEHFRPTRALESGITGSAASLRVSLGKGFVGKSYSLSRSRDLNTWTVLGTNTTDSTGALSRSDTGARTFPKAFYQWRAVP